MAAYDEITGSCDRRTCRTVISGLKSRAASTVTALKRYTEERHLEWHFGAVLKLTPGSRRLFRKLFPPRFLYFVFDSGKLRTAVLWREGSPGAPLRAGVSGAPPHAMTWPGLLTAHNDLRPPPPG